MNRFGVVRDSPFTSFSYNINNSSFEFALTSVFYINEWKKSLVQIGYFKKSFFDYELKIGRWHQDISSESILSSGSLIRGNNNIPIPQISLNIPKYKKYKILNHNLWIKAGFSHGWFSKGEYINPPYLHEKFLYIKKIINNNNEISLGLVHEAIWGGKTISHGNQPESFKDYLRVIFALPASNTGSLGDQKNAIGNHLGIWDLSYSKKYLNKIINFYYQHPFEDKSGAFQHFFDELKRLTLTSKSFDGLFGIEIKNNMANFISIFLYEYLNTTYQSGSSPQSDSSYGWDSYYNHYLYSTGWTYKGGSISNPLFTLGRLDKEGDYVSNNRIRAHHIGLKGSLSNKVKHKFFFTFSKNYGTYWDRHLFKNKEKTYKYVSGLNQFSALIQLDFINLIRNANITFSYAIDRGDVIKNSKGFQLSINYNFSNLSYSK